MQTSLLVHLVKGINVESQSSASAIAATTLSLIATLVTGPLSWLENSRSARPSVLLSVYLSVTLLFDIAATRTTWLLSTVQAGDLHARLSTCVLFAKFLLLGFEVQQKTRWLSWDLKEHSPEETSGLYSLGAFFWLNKLFMKGFRGVLSIDKLYPLDQALAADTMKRKFMHRMVNSSWKGRRWGLLSLLFQTLGPQLIPSVAPRLILLAASLCQPLLINALLDFLQREEHEDNHGYGLIAATGLTYTLIALSSALYWYFHERFLTMVRGCLVVAVYEHTTSLDLSATDESGALTLMSTDVELIMRGIRDLHEYWANIIQISLSCWLLQRELGAAFAAPLVVVIVSAIATVVVGSFLGPRQRAWMEAIQLRVSATANAISQMKLIKMSGMTEPVQSYIQGLRVSEIAIGGRWRTLLGIVVTLSHVPLAISPVMTFAVSSRKLDATTIFVSISYLTLLTAPLMVVFQKLPQLLGALTCIARIQKFLERDTRSECRNFYLSESSKSLVQSQAGGIEMRPLAGSHPSEIIVVDAALAWDDSMVLQDVNFTIAQSTFTMVIGPVASGKSTLCKALLGELPLVRGAITLRHQGRIGYCSQQPFLTNDTIRRNVIGFDDYEQERYKMVLRATMLDRDLQSLPDGDQARIGSGAITLSGGQKQRLAIARALYAKDTNLYIFDDVLSGLDAKTERHVFEHVFGRRGILRRRKATALLCTHQMLHVKQVDQVLRIHDGTIYSDKNVNNLLQDAEEDTGAPLQPEHESIEHAPATTLPDVEDETRRTGDFTVYGHYLRTIGVWPVALCLAASACHGFLLNFPKAWLTFWADDAARANPHHSQAYYVGIYGLLEVLFIGCFVTAGMTVLLVFIKESGAALHETALSTVINAPLRLFTKTDTGILTNYFAQDMTLIDGEMPLALVNLILDIFGVLGMAALLAASSPWLALAYPLMIAVLWVIQSFYLKTSRQLRLLDLEAKAPLYSHFIETLNGITTIRALGWKEESKKHSRMLLNRSQQATYLLAVVQRWLFFVLNMVVAVVATVLVSLITQLEGTSSSLSGASLVTLMSLSAALSDIVRFYAILETTIGAVARLRNFSSKTGSEQKAQQVFKPDPQWPSRGSIELKVDRASYSESGDDTALRHLNLTVQDGEKVALCGRTGR